ncbi:MarR family transcriptional regulator [Leucobacter viscericola]|uniref:MarR family transcriptional regulator n=2 Tax=Leucobacter viscericola TaxID=2714935 RepID=A0A6G7XJR9_9MICO|nr:MarR family transcriptional regulator [Leucobacter viscericola]
MVARVPGITYSSVAWRVLADLAEQGSARVSELAAQQRVAQPTMTALVNRLAGEGWVDRSPDPEDGRATLVVITPAGEEALNNYRHSMAERIVPLLVELSEQDRRALDRAAEIMLGLSEQV